MRARERRTARDSVEHPRRDEERQAEGRRDEDDGLAVDGDRQAVRLSGTGTEVCSLCASEGCMGGGQRLGRRRDVIARLTEEEEERRADELAGLEK